MLGLKDYYNHVYLEKAREFIKQFEIDEPNHPTPLKSHKPSILQRIQMDSPLRTSIHRMSRKADFNVLSC